MRERLGLVVIVALVVANMILIPLAFRNAQGSTDQKTGQAPTTSPRPEEPDSSAAKTPRAQPRQQTKDSAPLLMSSGGRIILSSPRGSCTDGSHPAVRLSTDRGRTFRTLKLKPRPTAVLALEVVDGESLLVIAADDSAALAATRAETRAGPGRRSTSKGAGTSRAIPPRKRWLRPTARWLCRVGRRG